MKKVMVLVTMLMVGVGVSQGTATADTEHLISLQGTASDNLGDPLSMGDVTVRIYDAATSGTLIYDSGSDFNGAIQKGIFDVLLGSVTPLDLDNTVKYYMEVDVNGQEVVGDAEGGRQEFWPGSGDHINLQKRVTGTCAGQVMVGINEDGTAKCEPDDGGTPGITSCTDCDASFVNEGQAGSISAGMVQFNYAGSTSEGGPASDASNLNCSGCVDTSDIDVNQVQRRVSSTCGAGSSIRVIASDGTVTCEIDDGDCTSCDSRFVNEADLNHLDASGGGPTNAVYVDTYGKVGIGTTIPYAKLTVHGDDTGVFGTGITYGVRGGSYGTTYGVYGSGGIGVYGNGEIGVRGNGSSCDFEASGSGTNYCATSSIRWKQNITEIDNALDQVLNLRGVYFDWDEEHGGQHDMGMIAEEVGQIVPEVVVYEEDGVYASGMDYGALTPLLVQAIKEQNEIISQLKELVCLDHPDAEVCE